MIDVRSVSFAYGKKGKPVLQDVSFALESGKIGILLGPNGVGKSTLIRCILGLAKPKSGDIYINGKSLKEMKGSERALEMAYVPQKVSFAPLSVYDSVMLGRLPFFGLSPKKKDHEAVISALEEFGLSGLMCRNVLELSGGEQQIVAIARAYVQGASVLVFDEPTSNLDIANRRLVLTRIKALKEKGLTILLSMHDLNDALELGERFFFMKDNAILTQGDISAFTSEVVSRVFGVEGEIKNINDVNIFIPGGKSK